VTDIDATNAEAFMERKIAQVLIAGNANVNKIGVKTSNKMAVIFVQSIRFLQAVSVM
jgi:hypothetical protein